MVRIRVFRAALLVAVIGSGLVGSADHNVYALSAANGAKLWSFTTRKAVESSPAVTNGAVYVGSMDGNVYAFDLAGGTASARRPPITWAGT